jgi:hypothetical protein
VKNKFKFLSLSQKGGKAKFTMMLPFDGGQLSLGAAMSDDILAQIKLAAAEPGKQTESLGVGAASQWGAQSAPIQFETVDELLPKETDYFYKDYRAISASLAPCYALDFSEPGVLEASVAMMKRQTVYKDHYFYSVDGWVGVVSDATWDATGQKAGGVPGINARLKLDSKKDPMLVRGVAMEPPAVHSASATVLFEFEFSHPDLVEQGRFWSLLGEEVGGEIVRLIVTSILGYWELSLVFQGAQEENKQIPADVTMEGGDEGELGAKRKQRMGAGGGDPITQRSETVKLSEALRRMLGLPDTVGEDVPDAMLLPAIHSLGERAQAGDMLLEAARAECLTIAGTAEGDAEGKLPEPIATIIKKADATELPGLTRLYQERAAKRMKQTCTKCGTQMSAALVRSSVEQGTKEPETTTQPRPVPRVRLH